MAADYENVVRNLGYNMPETMVDTLSNYACLTKNEPTSILELCCADGLYGQALKVWKEIFYLYNIFFVHSVSFFCKARTISLCTH